MPKVARSRTRVVRDAGSMFEPRRCARHSFRYALAPGCRSHRRFRVQAVRQRDDLTDTDIERSGKARRRMNRARDSLRGASAGFSTLARRCPRVWTIPANAGNHGRHAARRAARSANAVVPTSSMNRSAPIAAARVAPCAMRRRARNDRCEASRSFHAALLRIHVVPLRITDGQMGRWRGRRNTTSRNNFLLKLKKPAKPALQGSAKRFDAL